MIEIFFFIIKTVLTLFLIGYGFTALLIPEKLKENSLFTVPWFGMILIVLVGISTNIARIPLKQATFIIVAISLILLIYSAVIKKNIPVFSTKNAILFLYAFVILFFVLYTLIIKVGYPTTISLGNMDPLSYVNVSEFLIDNVILDAKNHQSYHPHLWAVGDLILYSYRWGSPIFLGFFASLFNVRSYQIYSILIGILFSFSFPLVYLFAEKIFNKTSYLLMFFIFLSYGLNSTLLYMLNHVFFAQFMFLGLMTLFNLFFYSYLEASVLNKNIFNSYDLILALITSSLTTIYPESTIFIILPLGMFFLSKIFTKDRLKIFFMILKILLLTILVSPITFGTALFWNYKILFLTTSSSPIGWEKIRYSTPFDMIGINNLFYYKNLSIWLDVLLSIAVIFIIFISLIKVKQKSYILSSLFFFFILLFLYQFLFHNYYVHLKTTTALIFFITSLFSYGFILLINNFKNKVIWFSVVLIFALLIYRSANRTMSRMYYHYVSVDKSLISLEELNRSNINKIFFTSDLFLGEYNLWRRLWQEYFLNKKNIVTKTNYAYETDLEKVQLVLTEKQVQKHNDVEINYKSIIWSNDYYQLGEIMPLKILE